MIYRHGDLILRRVSALPLNFDVLSCNPSCVLAEGESTGHQHVLTATEGSILFVEIHYPTTVLATNRQRDRYIKLEAPASLTHQEHKAITLQTGIYEILEEREYDFLEYRPIPVED